MSDSHAPHSFKERDWQPQRRGESRRTASRGGTKLSMYKRVDAGNVHEDHLQRLQHAVSERLLAFDARTHEGQSESEWHDPRIRALQDRVEALEKALLLARPTSSPTLELREISIDEAKPLVRQYYAEHGSEELFPSDVALALGIDPWVVFQATESLAAEGLLK